MGKAMSLLSRPVRDFNLESRAHKVISMDKPIPAPKHASDITDYERVKKDFPEALEEAQKKNEDLDKHLKDIFVVSHDGPPQPEVVNPEKPEPTNPERPLPMDKTQVEDFEYGFKELDNERIPVGKTSLRRALKFITEYQTDPKTNTYIKIAEDYVLPEDKVKNILKHFRLFEIYVPEQRQVKATFAGPSIPRPKVSKTKRKELPEPESKQE